MWYPISTWRLSALVVLAWILLLASLALYRTDERVQVPAQEAKPKQEQAPSRPPRAIGIYQLLHSNIDNQLVVVEGRTCLTRKGDRYLLTVLQDREGYYVQVLVPNTTTLPRSKSIRVMGRYYRLLHLVVAHTVQSKASR